MEWFYEKNGEQSGPISEAELQALFTAAELSASNLVWREGMTDWVTYGSVFASPAVATNVSRAGAERSAGSRRLREGNSNADLRAEALGLSGLRARGGCAKGIRMRICVLRRARRWREIGALRC